MRRPFSLLRASARSLSFIKPASALLLVMFSYVLPVHAQSSVLDLNDPDAKRTLALMAATGELKNRILAEGWIVVSSIALGVGIEKCSFPQSDDASRMWRPALESLSEDEIYTLNRLVTSNFRNAEKNGSVILERLSPVTRQAVLMLSDKGRTWNCREISQVFNVARNFNRNKEFEATPPKR